MIDEQRLSAELIRLRRDLHKHPEEGLRLPHTRDRLLAELQDLPLEITEGTNLTSIVAVLRATHRSNPCPAVLLRADMDALAVTEPQDLEFASKVPGVMHACGHDLHMTMLIGAIRLLVDRRDELAGDVVFMFQPGEEGHGGARMMIEEGVLDAAGDRVVAAFSMHVMTGDPRPARIGIHSGTAMAGSASFSVTVQGVGGHGSAPQLASDPVTTAAEIVIALQTAVTREFDARDPIVTTVGSLHAGTLRNIIPDSAQIDATVRCFTTAARDHAEQVLPRVARGIASAHGQKAVIDYTHNFSPLVNAETESALAQKVAAHRFGQEHVEILTSPKTASEDFAELLKIVPGTFVFIDATPPEGSDYNHSPNAIFDESVLIDGAHLFADYAIARLQIAQHDPGNTPPTPETLTCNEE